MSDQVDNKKRSPVIYIVIGILIAIIVGLLVQKHESKKFEKWREEQIILRDSLNKANARLSKQKDSLVIAADTIQARADRRLDSIIISYKKQINWFKRHADETIDLIDSNDSTYLRILSNR